MALQFKLSGDSSDLDQKLNALPAKAEKAGEAVQASMSKGMSRQAGIGATAYANQMKSSLAKAMGEPSPQEYESTKKRTRRLAEIAAKEDSKARQFWEKEDRQKDEQRMRTLAQARGKLTALEEAKEREKADRAGGMSRMARIALGGFGASVAAHAIASLYNSAGESRNNIALSRAGLSDSQLNLVSQSQRSAQGSFTPAGRADISEQINSEIEAEMERKIRVPQTMSSFEQWSDAIRKIQKSVFPQVQSESIKSMYQAASDSRIKTLRQTLANNIETAQANEANVNGLMVSGASGRMGGFGEQIAGLRKQQSELGDLTDPNNVQVFQQLQAKVKGLLPYLQEATNQYHAQVDAGRGTLTPANRLSAIRAEQKALGEKLSAGSALGPEERQMVQARLSQLGVAEFGGAQEQRYRTLDAGLMGAGGRRAIHRQQIREQHELNRIDRMARSGSKEARAFMNDVVNPAKGREADANKASEKYLASIDAKMTQLVSKTGGGTAQLGGGKN